MKRDDFFKSAIAAYQTALALIPSGTWKTPKDRGEYLTDLAPPEGGVKARLERTQKAKQEWESRG